MTITTKEGIDDAVSARDVEFLTDLIRLAGELDADVKEYLADVIRDLLTDKRKFPRRRPPKALITFANGREQPSIEFRVWQTKKRKGYKKVESAIDDVAKELKITPRTVYKYWRKFDPIECEMSFRKMVMESALGRWRRGNPDANELPSLKAVASDALQAMFGTFPGWAEDYDALVSEILKELEDLDSLINDHYPATEKATLTPNGFRLMALRAIIYWLTKNPTGRELTFREMAADAMETAPDRQKGVTWSY